MPWLFMGYSQEKLTELVIKDMEKLKMKDFLRIEDASQYIKIIAKFDDGYYTCDKKNWARCDALGNVFENSENKMTREEAVRKIKLNGFPCIALQPIDIVNALEALGLLKFEEPTTEFEPSSLRLIKSYDGDACGLSQKFCNAIVNEIYRQGFKIVKT